MSTWYVNAASGADANSGASWALAKKTLSGANAVASAGDTIVCQGIFYEAIPAKVLNYIGYGYCEFNARGLSYLTISTANAFTTITFAGGSLATMLTTAGLSFYGCIFRDSPIGIQIQATAAFRFHNCRFYNLVGYGVTVSAGGYGVIAHLTNCEFFANGIDIYPYMVSLNVYPWSFYGCSFGSPVMLKSYSAVPFFSDSCAYDFTNGKNIYNGTDKTTLAAWRTSQGAPWDVNSVDRTWRADVGDYANRALRSTPAGYLQTAGVGYSPIGLYSPGLTVSNNANSSPWTNGVFTGTVIDSYGKISLLAGYTTGTAATDVIDLGAAISVNALELNLSGETYPNFYSDTTVELRGSNTLFSKSAASPAWTTVPRNSEVASAMSPNTYRYWQVRVTLRGLW